MKRLIVSVVSTFALIVSIFYSLFIHQPSFDSLFRRYIYKSDVPADLRVEAVEFIRAFGQPDEITLSFSLPQEDTLSLISSFDFKKITHDQLAAEGVDEFWENCRLDSKEPDFPYSSNPVFSRLIFAPKYTYVKVSREGDWLRKGLLLVDDTETKIFYYSILELRIL